MPEKRSSTSAFRWLPQLTARLVVGTGLGAILMWGTVYAGDLLRGGATSSPASAAPASSPGTALTTTAPLPSAQDRLARTTQAIEAVKQMQVAARALAVAGPNSLQVNLPAVPVNSYLKINGLVPAVGVPKDLLNPVAGESINLWTGAKLPAVATTTANGVDTTTVTIKQTQQQAVLNWQTFNIGKNTTLNFDQSAGGVDAGQWIAFNKIGVTGSPSQILGAIKAEGQVYVINPNGIIFGGSSQVNTHALVASSLPINDNLVSRGLLNNPDAQFLFSALAIAGGSNGTPAFTPTVSDPVLLGGTTESYVLARKLAAGNKPVVSYAATGEVSATLTSGDDFTVGDPDTSGKTALTFTTAGQKKIAGAAVTISYTPAGDQYGNVTVNAGAQLTAPTTADHIGGRIALVGPNVTNAGTLSTADGQTILAAGLQVGMAVHSGSDASLRGLDVYVGAVTDPALKKSTPAGTATNADLTTADIGVAVSDISTATTNPSGLKALGLIEAPRGDVYITGKTVNQLGFIDSSTSVAYNGRVDLLAFDNAVSSRGLASAPPFFWQETGQVTLGADSVTRILPELTSTDTVIGTTLALHSQINLQGAAINFATDAVFKRGATVLAPSADVTAAAGTWRFTSGGLSENTGFPQKGTIGSFIYDSGDISVGSGATIDVAGSADVGASVSENIISVQLRGPELANSPLQRNGPLRGQTVQVDVRQNGVFNGVPWVGTPLADASGYVGLIGRTVGELTTDGGTVTLKAGGAVTLPLNSAINVSAGWINYAGTSIATSKLATSNGRIVDIAQATPDQTYLGIYSGTSTATDPKWGTTQSTSNPLAQTTYDAGYVQGGNGGTLSITAPTMTLAGNLTGKTTAGARQVKGFGDYGSSTLQGLKDAGIDPLIWVLGNQPKAATLALAFEKQYAQAPGSTAYSRYSPTPPNIYIEAPGSVAPIDARALVLSSSLFDSSLANYGGFGSLKIDNSADNYKITPVSNSILPVDPVTGLQSPLLFGSITVAANPSDPKNVTLRMAPGGSLTLDAGNISLQGAIVAPAGQLSFTAHNFWQGSGLNITQFGLPLYNDKRGNISLAPGVLVDASGLIVDNRAVAAGGNSQPLAADGGSITLAGSNVALGAGGVLSVNGGATVSGSGKVAYGAGGAITLKAGADPAFGKGGLLGGALTFSAVDEVSSVLAENLKPLQGYAGGKGGSMTISAPLIQIGSVAGTTPVAGTLLLSPDFFSNGGFSSFSLEGQGRVKKDAQGKILNDGAGNNLYTPAVYITPSTVLYPRVKSPRVDVTTGAYQWTQLSPLAYQYTPVNLKFAARGATDASLGNGGVDVLLARGDLLVGEGAVIKTDPKGTISFTGQTVSILGAVKAPGGAISVSGGLNSSVLFSNVGAAFVPTVDLGPKSSLSVVGVTVLSADPSGKAPGDTGYLRTGSVVAGGTISVTGNTVAEAGAVVDVSGWSDTKDPAGLLNAAPTQSGQAPATKTVTPTAFNVVPTVVESNAGSITFTGGEGLFIDATLKGTTGGTSAAGGTLTITSGVVDNSAPPQATLQVTQSGPTVPAPFYTKSQTAVGRTVVTKKGDAVIPLGYFAADTFTQGGFDNLALNGNVNFSGPVTLAARGNLFVGNGGLIVADKSVTLSGNYVALGRAYVAPPGIANPYSPFFSVPRYGAGSLSITAGTAKQPGLLDIGNLSLQGIGAASLTSVGGDIRGYGTFNLAGSLSLTAGQIYPVTAEKFTIAAYNYTLPTDASGALPRPGSVTFMTSGVRQLPLSAGGTLNVYAQVIDQSGVLRAPIGSINLGWDGTGTAPIDPLSNLAAPVTERLVLRKGSETSVAANLVDPATGKSLSIPYGVSLDGSSWIDPNGIDITNGGLPSKTVRLTASNINVAAGALIDTSGGGDLYAYQFVKGVGGTNDVLAASSASFAVLPWYQADYAPNAGFNTNFSTASSPNLVASFDQGYVSVTSAGDNRLAVGDKIHVDLQNGAGARDYTLLPARYALFPGAYLVTPKIAAVLPDQPVAQADGSTVTTGYRFNSFNPSRPTYVEFEVAPKSVVQARAQYIDFSANSFFGQNPTSTAQNLSRLPIDGGQLVVAATTAMTLQGSVSAAAGAGGRGGLVDISSPDSIIINSTGTGSAADTLYLSSSQLSAFASGSLLVGGIRSTGADGTQVTTTADTVTVDNVGQPLTGSDVILVANQSVVLAPGAEVKATAVSPGPADTLVINGSIQLDPVLGGFIDLVRGGTPISFPSGTPAKVSIKASVAGTITRADGTTVALLANTATTLEAGSKVTLAAAGKITASGTGRALVATLGDGALVRVSSASSAKSSRTGVASSKAPSVVIGAGAKVSGGSVVIDSTYATKLDPTAVVGGGSVALNSGQISLVLADSPSNKIAANSLVLSGAALANLQTGAKALSLLSYSSIDTFGAGVIGSSAYSSLELHTGEIRGFNLGADERVVFAAQTVSLDNSPGVTGPGAVVVAGTLPKGTLAFSANKIVLGANQLAIDQFANVELTSTGGVLAQGTGGLATPANLTITAPVVTAANAARQTIAADGTLELKSSTGTTAAITGGLGAQLTLSGKSVVVSSNVALPSGKLILHATGGAPTVGDSTSPDVRVSGVLDVSGTTKTFQGDLVKFTDAGRIDLISDQGSVSVASGGSLKLAAPVASGQAGQLSIAAPLGTFVLAAQVKTSDGSPVAPPLLDARLGQGGDFSLDVLALRSSDGASTTLLNSLETALAAGNFTRAQSIRVRTGDVTVDSTVKARSFDLSADQGSIEVSAKGSIDASGPTGGTIELAAGGSVRLRAGAALSVQGINFDSAGHGGAITLAAGSAGGSTTGARGASDRLFGSGTAVVDLQAGSTLDLSVVNNLPIQLNASGLSSISLPVGNVGLYFPAGTPGNDLVAFTSAGTLTAADGVVTPFAASAAKPFATHLAPGTTVTLSAAGSVSFASGTGGSIPVNLPSTLADGTMLTVATNRTTDLTAYNESGSLHLRAPQVLDQSGKPYDVQINPIKSTFLRPANSTTSNIYVEGYRVFDLTPLDTGAGSLITGPVTTSLSQPAGGLITDSNVNIQASVEDNGALFAGGLLSDGSKVAGNTAAITTNLLTGTNLPASLTKNFHVRPGAEIINTKGDLRLNSTWDFAAGTFYNGTGDPALETNWSPAAMPFRFGAKREPGYLTLRAQGNLVFGVDPDNLGSGGYLTPASLNDGFGGYDGFDNSTLWTALLLPSGIQSWSYRLVAGADFSAADSRQALPMVRLANAKGSLLLGQDAPALKSTVPTGTDLQNIIPANYQTIRTGTGALDIYAGRDVRILNNLATIYTAGAQTVPIDNFDVPEVDFHPAQYSTGGGNLTIVAQGNIAHLTATGAADSSKELPMNWLNRRGWIGPNGQFGSPRDDQVTDSTSWWIDFSNFFEGVGALGGGHVTLQAGQNITNVDAVVPTNQRTTKQTITSKVATATTATTTTTTTGAVDPTTFDRRALAQTSLQLGGGNLTIRAGSDLDGGVYYVERGQGTLRAGNSIHTNATRVTVPLTQVAGLSKIAANANAWLPTTLFLGNGNFSIQAGGDVLVGAVANPFLLPQSLANNNANAAVTFEKTYFSTYATNDAVDVSSLTGSVTLKDHPDIVASGTSRSGSLLEWLTYQLSTSSSTNTASTSQPWLSLAEDNIAPFATVAGLMPSSLTATAFGGDINLVGGLTLSPAPQGQLVLTAAGSINGVQPNTVSATNALGWGSALINLSDADPTRIPSPGQPLSLPFVPRTTVESVTWKSAAELTLPDVDALFKESGSTTGNYAVIQTKQALHAPGPLHTDDPNPVVLYAEKGDISGLTLFAGKSARIVAGQDISDIALYVQNNHATDVTTVAAGRDIIPYNANSALRARALTSGGQFISNEATSVPGSGTPVAGDIQVGGSGRVETLAGRNISLGVGPTAVDGTSVGIKTVGNARNPSLGFDGADIVVAAGLGPVVGLSRSDLDFAGFINAFLNPSTAGNRSATLLPELGKFLGVAVDPKNTAAGNTQIWESFNRLPAAQRDSLALDVFYLVLRNAGRDRNNAASADFGNYNSGYVAITTLFGRRLDFSDAAGSGFIDQYLNPVTGGLEAKQYLPQLNGLIGGNASSTDAQVWSAFTQLPVDQQHSLALKIFTQVLADSAKQTANSTTSATGKTAAAKALGALFAGQTWKGNITLATRLIETTNGGNITVTAPGGDITVGRATDLQKADQGILTAHGGDIALFANGNVNVGTSRIFTLRGGNEIIWSTNGNIAAGSGSKTVKSAPPTRVLIDPQSGDVKNDLAGLATGGGIGVLATLAGVAAGDVDLIAPAGTVDAGDAGIRSSGNLNIAAQFVLNASNIQVGGTSAGTPPPPPAPNLGSLTAASTASAGASSAATDVAKQNSAAKQPAELPSLISVEVLGYGGDDEDEEDKRKKTTAAVGKATTQENSPVKS